jgi:hypothetical protein
MNITFCRATKPLKLFLSGATTVVTTHQAPLVSTAHVHHRRVVA